MNILVIGKNGQVARALSKALNYSTIFVSSKELDLENIEQIIPFLSSIPNINLIINSSAYTEVDKAETEKEKAFKINALAPLEIAKFCKSKDIPLIHYSSDYVFGDSGTGFRNEDDKTNPINYYGYTKLEGEKNIIKNCSNYIIIRTSWVYYDEGKNFPNTILKLVTEREELKIVADQYGAPTYAGNIANTTNHIISLLNQFDKFPSGIYNFTDLGVISWYDFAIKIIEIAKNKNIALKVNKIIPITSEEYVTAAKRPKNSRLDNNKIYNIFNINQIDWNLGLKIFMENKYNGSN